MVSVSNPEFAILSDDSDYDMPAGEVYEIQLTEKLPIIPGTVIFSNYHHGHEDCRDDGQGQIINSSGTVVAGVDYNTGIISFWPYVVDNNFKLTYHTIQSNLIPTLDPNIEKRIAALEAQLDGLAEFLNKINNGGLE